MLEIGTSGSVGGEGGNILAYPAQKDARRFRLSRYWLTSSPVAVQARHLRASF